MQNICGIKEFRPKDLNILKHLGGTLPSAESSKPLGNMLARSQYRSHPSFINALDLLQQLLLFDPEARITAMGALQHPYFADYASNPLDFKRGKNVAVELPDGFIEDFVADNCGGII